MKWIPAAMPPEPDGFGDGRSAEVLLVDASGCQRVGFAVHAEAVDREAGLPAIRWKIAGPDWYDFDGPTHWMPLPEPPS